MKVIPPSVMVIHVIVAQKLTWIGRGTLYIHTYIHTHKKGTFSHYHKLIAEVSFLVSELILTSIP